MNTNRFTLPAVLVLLAPHASAGIVSIPPSVAGVPVDSPWVIAGLAATLAVVGARILHNRRK